VELKIIMKLYVYFIVLRYKMIQAHYIILAFVMNMVMALNLMKKKAIEWYTLAAKYGDIDSYAKLGRYYEKITKYDEALSWYSLAVKGDNPFAMLGLERMKQLTNK